MESPEQKALEEFIHRQLQKLPEHEAPEDLSSRVLAAIEARQNRPWWKQPFTEWPRRVQSILFIVLTAAFSAAAWLAARPVEAVSLDALSRHASGWSGLLQSAAGVLERTVSTVGGLSWYWFAGLGGVFVLMYLACIGAGIALYRVTSRASSYTA